MVLVDGAQSVPHQPTDVAAMDGDFLAFSGHKMLGPVGGGRPLRQAGIARGNAALSGRRKHDPPRSLDGFEPGDLPAKFEAGTPPIVPAIGLGARSITSSGRECRPSSRYECLLTERAHEVLGGGGGRSHSWPRTAQQERHRQFHARADPRPRHGPALGSPWHCRPCRAPLRDAAAQAVRGERHGPGELLFLQHDGRNRQARPGPGGGEADLSSAAGGELEPSKIAADWGLGSRAYARRADTVKSCPSAIVSPHAARTKTVLVS